VANSTRRAPATSATTPHGVEIGGGYFDEIEFVGEEEKGRNVITVIRARKGQTWVLRLQEWWPTPNGSWAPTKNGGISLPLDNPQLAEMVAKGFNE